MPKPPDKWLLKKVVAAGAITLCDDVCWLLKHPVMRIANTITRIA